MRLYSTPVAPNPLAGFWLILLPMLLLALGTNSAQAREFRINQDCVVLGCLPGDPPGFPIQITEPGHYRLVGNLYLEDDNDFAIFVNALDGAVSIDLGGHAIIGPHGCSGGTPSMAGGAPVDQCSFTEQGPSGSAIHVSAVSELTIRNGMIRGFSSGGISIFPGAGAVALLEDLQITENFWGIRVQANSGSASANVLVRIRRVSLNRNLTHGLRTTTSNDGAGLIMFENSQVFGNGVGANFQAPWVAVLREVHISRSRLQGLSFGGATNRCYSVSYFANNDGDSQVFSCPGLFNRCLDGTC